MSLYEQIQPKDPKLPAVHITYRTELGLWELLKDCSVEDERKGAELTARKGYLLDLSSVPRILWVKTAPFELSIIAPLFHDLLYENGGYDGFHLKIRPQVIYSRKDGDLLFRDHMRMEQVPLWRRVPAYHAVRLFGESSWQRAA